MTETGASNLRELCLELGHEEEAKIATAVNGEFVPRDMRSKRRLEDGDEVEIVAPRQGG
jgi:sulfur carrier protein